MKALSFSSFIKMEFPMIDFKNEEEQNFTIFNKCSWNPNEERMVEFFPGEQTKVTLIHSTDKDLVQRMEDMVDGRPMVIDFEWKAFSKEKKISLIQICSSKGALLIRYLTKKENSSIKSFLHSSSGNKFVGKGISGDVSHLLQRFGSDFDISIEDIEATRLGPYEESANFEIMTEKFAGTPTAQYKNKKVSLSNWEAKTLTFTQVLYAAFDVVALYKCYQNFKPPRNYRFVPTYNLSFSIPPQAGISYFKPPFTVKGLLYRNMKCKKEVEENHCNLCEEDFNSLEEVINHCWAKHSISSIKLINLKTSQILYFMDNLIIKPGKTMGCNLCSKMKYKSFSDYRKHAYTHISKGMEFDDDDENDNGLVPNVFLLYLAKTGRISPTESKCLICDSVHSSNEDFIDHCWNEHSDIFLEWAPITQYMDINVISNRVDLCNIALDFLYGLNLVKNSNGYLKCRVTKCNYKYIDPISLMIHIIQVHFNLIPCSKSQAQQCSEYNKYLSFFIKCSEIFPNGWQNSLYNQFKKMASISEDEKLYACSECNEQFNQTDFYNHCIENHLILMPIIGGFKEEEKNIL